MTTKMTAQTLVNEYYESFANYSRPRKAAFKARVTRLAKQYNVDSPEATLLGTVIEDLGMEVEFSTDPLNKEIIPPVFRLQLIRDGSPSRDRKQITSPLQAASMLAPYLEVQDRENLVILMMDIKGSVIGMSIVATGTIDSALVSTREVFKPALIANAKSIILGHNHPSGDPTPSPEDVIITTNLVKAGELLEVDVLDHVIIGDDGRSASLNEMGLMDNN